MLVAFPVAFLRGGVVLDLHALLLDGDGVESQEPGRGRTTRAPADVLASMAMPTHCGASEEHRS